MSRDDLEATLQQLERSLEALIRHEGAMSPEAESMALDLELRIRRLRRQLAREHGPMRSPGGDSDVARRSNGWRRNLYRDPERGWLAGVCAGLARSLDVEVWLVRLVVVTLGLFNALLMLALYLLAALLMARRPSVDASDSATAASRSAPQLPDVQARYARLEQRLQALERTVTSSSFSLERELAALERR